MASSGQVLRSIQRFMDFAADLIQSDCDTFDDRLALFIDYCKSDEVFRDIHRQLQSFPGVDFEKWYQELQESIGSMAGSGNLVFPTDLEARLVIQYEFLTRIQDRRIQLLGFTSQFFSVGNSIDEHIRALNNAVTRPLVRELKYRLEEVLERLPKDAKEQVSSGSLQIIHAQNLIQQIATGSHINQSANVGMSEDLHAAFSSLREAVKGHESDIARLKDHLENIDAAEELAVAKKPKLSVIATLLGSLPYIATIATSTEKIMGMLKG